MSSKREKIVFCAKICYYYKMTLYMQGLYDKNEAIKRLLAQKLSDQWVFKNEKI